MKDKIRMGLAVVIFIFFVMKLYFHPVTELGLMVSDQAGNIGTLSVVSLILLSLRWPSNDYPTRRGKGGD